MNEIRKYNTNRIIITDLNINTIRNKSEMLKEAIGKKIDILLISETKLDNTFPLSQFSLERFASLYRLDRTDHGAGLFFSLGRIYLRNCYLM